VRKLIDKIPAFLRNRYSVTLIVFVVWILFFNPIDILTLMDYRTELKELNLEKVRLEDRIQQTRKALNELSTDQEMLERFARERYKMRRENEVVFVIERD